MQVLTDISLSGIIIEKIQAKGPIPFRDFMEMALYYPELGYYTSPAEKIGNNGDFYTTPHLTSLLGELLAKQLEEMWRLAGGNTFTVVEYGAGNGLLCHDIMEQAKESPAFYEALRYCIIERSAAMRERERALVCDKVEWRERIDEIAGFTGCVISNELLDNLSVHRVVMQDELMEVFVDYNDGFTEVLAPASAELRRYFEELNIALPVGFRTEVNLDALAWIDAVGIAMKKGFVVTVDYGYPSEELYSTHRRNGTLVCYHQHQINNNPYVNIGRQDITAHVNFSALSHRGLATGLQHCGFSTQGYFLHCLGLATHLRDKEARGNSNTNVNTASFAHTLMTDMGSKFKVLIQQKGLKNPVLSGMKLSQKIR